MNVEILSDEIEYEGHPSSLSIIRDITERIKSEKEAQRRATQTALINEVGKRVSSQLDLNSLLRETVNSLSHSFDYYGVMILLLDSKKKRLTLRAIAGGYADIFPSGLSIKLGEGMIGMAAQTGKTQHSDDVSKAPNYVKKADELTRSELSVPICSGKKTLGVLDIQSDRLNAFDESDIAANETLTSQIAAAIENARLYERAQEEILERKEAEKELRKSRNNLIKAMKETDNIMQNVEEGLFLLNSKFELGSQFSKALQEIFSEDELAKVNILDILEGKISPDDLNNVREYLELMFDPSIIEENILELNPLSDVEMNFKVTGKLLSRTRYLTFKFRRILVNDEIVGLITTVNDITEQVQLTKKLEESQQQSKRQMEWLLNLLHVEPALIQEFIDSAQNEFDEINRILKQGTTGNNFQEILDKIYRSVHLVKGNASLLDLSLFASVAHKCEELISRLKEKSVIEGKDFVALNLKISDMQQSIQEVKSLIEKISNIQSHFRPKRSYESEKLISSINNFIANLSKDCAKSVQFNHHNFDGMSIPHNYRLLVKDLLVQLARNSVSHGIESEKERTKLNKDKVATIKLSSK
jgi:putative methionine-R-sulfoxide reductase with GAF domain/HPt (histidine-containing phosphotransfer) domain-containing protein